MGIGLEDKCLYYTLQFADDQVFMANDKEYLEYMTRKLHEEGGLEMNTQKTKYQPIGGAPRNI